MPDLAEARESLGSFASMVGCSLEHWQARTLKLVAWVTTIVAPRQSGKSRSLAVLALWSAFRRREQRVLLISAGEDASRRLLAEVRRIATGSPLLAGSVVDEQAGLLTLSNGSEVRSVPASERQVRGWAVDLLLVDEAAMVPDDLLLSAAFPTTAARPEARIVLASSATVAAGAFFDHAIRGEQGAEHVRTFRWALTDAHWIAPSTIEAARESMSSTRFAAEYEGVFASGADALFSRAALDRATADYSPSSLDELHGPARMLGGVDWGASVDHSAIVAIARLPTAERIFGVACAYRWPAGVPLPNVIGEIADSPAHFARLTMERNGLGEPCCQELSQRIVERPPETGGGRRQHVVLDGPALDDWMSGRPVRRPTPGWKLPSGAPLYSDGPIAPRPQERFVTVRAPVHTTAEMKAATYSVLRLLIDQERLLLPASAEELRRELLMLRVDLSPAGIERIEAGVGHDDLADALMLGLGPWKGRTGRWRSVLADLAEPRRALDPVPVQGGPIVRSGGGVEVPKVPVWQSVVGPTVPVPDAAESGSELGGVRRAVARAIDERSAQEHTTEGSTP